MYMYLVCFIILLDISVYLPCPCQVSLQINPNICIQATQNLFFKLKMCQRYFFNGKGNFVIDLNEQNKIQRITKFKSI